LMDADSSLDTASVSDAPDSGVTIISLASIVEAPSSTTLSLKRP
jgi:hypothetical protein